MELSNQPIRLPGLKPGVCSGLILSGAFYPDLKIGVWRRRTYQFFIKHPHLFPFHFWGEGGGEGEELDGAPRASPRSPKTIPTYAKASVGHPPMSEIRRSMID